MQDCALCKRVSKEDVLFFCDLVSFFVVIFVNSYSSLSFCYGDNCLFQGLLMLIKGIQFSLLAGSGSIDLFFKNPVIVFVY